MAELFIRYIHFISIFALCSALVAEHLLVEKTLSKKQFQKILIIDAIYGVAAAATFLSGLSLWLWVGKPSSFYSGNPLFHIKLSLFVLIALISIYPTVFFLKNRSDKKAEIEIPKKIIMLIRIELTLLLFIPLLAVFMARGFQF